MPISSRSGEVVEPLLSLQWFCKMESLAKPALEAYRDGRIRFVPERFGRTYEQWLENIRDWNVSRQIWWGHQLPVWYTPDGRSRRRGERRRSQAHRPRDVRHDELRRDPDTLDTWFSSGLWPFSILGWPEATPELKHWYPNQVMITSREIIFLWVARMVMLGMHFAGNIPFRTVFVTPLVFDIHGRKMSKSLGNVIDPIDLIANYGADGTRFGICARCGSSRKSCASTSATATKRGASTTSCGTRCATFIRCRKACRSSGTLPPAERAHARRSLDPDALARNRRRRARGDGRLRVRRRRRPLIQFGWYEFCDWYLESTKLGGSDARRRAVLRAQHARAHDASDRAVRHRRDLASASARRLTRS